MENLPSEGPTFWIQIVLSLAVGLPLGAGLGLWVYRWLRSLTIRAAEAEAQEIRDHIQENLDLRKIEEGEIIQGLELELWSKSEAELLKLEDRLENLSDLVDEQKKRLDGLQEEEKKRRDPLETSLRSKEQSLKSRTENLQNRRLKARDLRRDLTLKLSDKSQISLEQAKSQIAEELEADTQRRAQGEIERGLQYTSDSAEEMAQALLDKALNRFQRPYCGEKGLGLVNFPEGTVRQRFCDPDGQNIQTLQRVCGCDLVIEDQMDMIGIAGYDPVRRELTRRTLNKVLQEKKDITPQIIERIAETQKRELFRQIKNDGDLLAKELRLEGLHPEIRQMMGSLRYRYSFTQNQYFHCGEVGWLCGLLASELKLDIKKARRSGMLHDIGKSMDHAQDGGHAMIGADFIAARGEVSEVVHNVRAHHFDETPSTDTAFLVIAADAVSGARPGARRSTLENYNQKVNELQEIARNFDGVMDVFILNGGRECRVLVNSRKIDDLGSLKLSEQIARKIEEDCNYPGQIKIVVVRETLTTETTFQKTH